MLSGEDIVVTRSMDVAFVVMATSLLSIGTVGTLLQIDTVDHLRSRTFDRYVAAATFRCAP